MAASAIGALMGRSQPQSALAKKGRIKQSAFIQNFDPSLSFDEMCSLAKRLGIVGFDVVQSENWPILRKYGLIPTLDHGRHDDTLKRANRASLSQSIAKPSPIACIKHTFADTPDVMDEVFWAGIYAGFRFRHSLEAGRHRPPVAVQAGQPHR